MLPIESYKDVLFIVLAFCVLWLTIFISWLLFYWIALFRDAKSVVNHVKSAVERVDHLACTVREKFEHSAASFTIIAQAAKELIVWAIQERAKKKSSRKKEE